MEIAHDNVFCHQRAARNLSVQKRRSKILVTVANLITHTTDEPAKHEECVHRFLEQFELLYIRGATHNRLLHKSVWK